MRERRAWLGVAYRVPRQGGRPPEHPADRHQPGFRRRARLRGAADPPLLDRPVAPLRHMAISIALLGYGASGSFLALFLGPLRRRFTTVFALSAELFGLWVAKY
jgi:hypothetical protein